MREIYIPEAFFFATHTKESLSFCHTLGSLSAILGGGGGPCPRLEATHRLSGRAFAPESFCMPFGGIGDVSDDFSRSIKRARGAVGLSAIRLSPESIRPEGALGAKVCPESEWARGAEAGALLASLFNVGAFTISLIARRAGYRRLGCFSDCC